LTPVIISPTSGSQNVSLEPTIVAGEFVAPADTVIEGDELHTATFVILQVKQEEEINAETGEVEQVDNTYLIWEKNVAATSVQVPSGVLKGGETYFVSVRYLGKNVEGSPSKWSIMSKFTTKVTKVTPTPIPESPINGEQTQELPVTFRASAFVSAYSAEAGETPDTHAMSYWQLLQYDASIQKYRVVGRWKVDAGGALTSQEVSGKYIEMGQKTYFWRVAYKGTESEWSEWTTHQEFLSPPYLEYFIQVPSVSADADGIYHTPVRGIQIDSLGQLETVWETVIPNKGYGQGSNVAGNYLLIGHRDTNFVDRVWCIDVRTGQIVGTMPEAELSAQIESVAGTTMENISGFPASYINSYELVSSYNDRLYIRARHNTTNSNSNFTVVCDPTLRVLGLDIKVNVSNNAGAFATGGPYAVHLVVSRGLEVREYSWGLLDFTQLEEIWSSRLINQSYYTETEAIEEFVTLQGREPNPGEIFKHFAPKIVNLTPPGSAYAGRTAFVGRYAFNNNTGEVINMVTGQVVGSFVSPKPGTAMQALFVTPDGYVCLLVDGYNGIRAVYSLSNFSRQSDADLGSLAKIDFVSLNAPAFGVGGDWGDARYIISGPGFSNFTQIGAHIDKCVGTVGGFTYSVANQGLI